jgi:tRNA dimethylallyltransferase
LQPTASGKSDIAFKLARALEKAGRGAVIVNADSAQLYSDLPILSAAPSQAEQAEIPHRLYGAWDGRKAAPPPIGQAAPAMRLPRRMITAWCRSCWWNRVILRTLLDGIAPVPDIAPDVRETVRAMPVALAHAELARLDPERAATLHANDTTRVHRALEVVLDRANTCPLATKAGRRDWRQDHAGAAGSAAGSGLAL